MNITFDQTTATMRFVTKTVVTSGAAAIITNAVKATTPDDVKRLKRLTIWAGTAAISGLVAEHASQRVMKSFDGMVTAVKNAIVHEEEDVVEGTVVDN